MNTEIQQNRVVPESVLQSKKDLFYAPVLKSLWALIQVKGTKSRIWKFMFCLGCISWLGSIFAHFLTGTPFFLKYEDTNLYYKIVSSVVSMGLGFYTAYIGMVLGFEIVEGKKSILKNILLLRTEQVGSFKKFCYTRIAKILRIFGGYILFVVPGIIWSYRFRFAEIYTFRDGLSQKEAFKKSSDLVFGIKWKLAVLDGCLLLLTFMACIPLFLGLLWLVPLVFLSHVFLFVSLATVQNPIKDAILESPSEVILE